MRQPIGINHQLHPARQQGKSLARTAVIKFCIATNRTLMIGTASVDTVYDQIKFEFPDAVISKGEDYVLMEKN